PLPDALPIFRLGGGAGDVGQPRLEGLAAEVFLERGGDGRLVLHHQPFQRLQLLLAPGDVAGAAAGEGAPQPLHGAGDIGGGGCLGGGCRGGLGGHGVILPDRESLIVTNRLASLVASGEPPESARIRRVRAPRSARTAPARPRRTAAPNGTGRNRCARRGTTRCRAGPSAPTTAPPARA